MLTASCVSCMPYCLHAADAYEVFIRNVMLGIPTAPTFCQMLGFDALNPEVPKRADETGALVAGKADGIDLEKGLVS